MPRLPYNNSPTYTRRNFTRDPWRYTYRAISTANDALRALNNGSINLPEELRARAYLKFVQGISYGSLGLFFDKGVLIDENTNLEKYEVELHSHRQLLVTGLGFLEDCIVLCDNSFTTPSNWINGFPMTNDYLKQLCHSLIARFISVSPRTAGERQAVNWAEVINHIDQGITLDFAPEGNDAAWWNDLLWQSNRFGTNADNKLHGPSDISGNYEKWRAAPLDERYNFDNYSNDRRVTGSNDDPKSDGKYMRYNNEQYFRASRGTYSFSNYKWTKHSYHYPRQFGPMPFLTVVEMDMLRAEALMRTGGSRAEVAELVNKTRVGIGEMPPLTGSEPDLEIWKWLCYEKRIETLGSASGLEWFDYRGWTNFEFLDIPPGTLVHFPVPGVELEIMMKENYTFGGAGNPGTTPSVKPGVIDFNYIQQIRKMREESVSYKKNIGKDRN